jgi:hypothetical protein
MTPEEKGNLFRKRFLQISFGQLLQTRNEYAMLFEVLPPNLRKTAVCP